MNADQVIAAGDGLYSSPLQLADGTWCCIGRFLFSWAIMVGIDETGYRHRFCFEHRADAEHELAKMQTVEDEPCGYLVRK